ncbi:TPR-like protein [Rhizoctonia solani]|uniref:TPR-like protein n=1 Tax=Rhizoctonia solani TaxID=456999 RepID=A0A8H7IGY2_9AGAM|nr:TPR-like protein [Rhizoctonia solani]
MFGRIKSALMRVLCGLRKKESAQTGTGLGTSFQIDSRGRKEHLRILWEVHLDHFRRFGRLEDIERVVEYATLALNMTPEDDPDLPRRHAALGVSYSDRYRRLGELPDLEKAIECLSRALELTPEGHPDLPRRHADLGASYGDRYRRLGVLADLDKAIEWDSSALDLTPEDHPDLSRRHAALGASYGDRYRRQGELEDLKKVVEYNSRALALTPDGHSEMPSRHAALGASYSDRYRRLGDLVDLEESIKCEHRALALTPDGHPELQFRHSALGASYSDRYRRLGELTDLEKTIECLSCALKLTPQGHPVLPRRHADLGASYTDRYRRLGELGDLEKSIEFNSHALTLTPEGHSDLPRRYADLGVSHIDRYQRLGELDDMDKAIEYGTKALHLTPNGHPHLQMRHATLGVSYGDRYRRMGKITDLDNAVEHFFRALKLTPEVHSDLPSRYADLGSSYSDRYRRLGELTDLEESIKCNSCALKLAPEGHPHLPRWHTDLGGVYSDRYRRLGKLADLEKALECRYRHLDEPADLEKAIELDSRALSLTPEGHPDLPRRYAALGVSYGDRYERIGALSDLDKAIECHSNALSLTPDGHPHLSSRHYNWATSYHYRYQHTHDLSHLKVSLDSFRKASQLLNGAPRDVFNHALNWAKLASKHSYLNCIEAFRATIGLLPHFIWLGTTASQRYHDLLSAKSVGVRAASAAILSSEYSLALEWLEHARCVVWNQSLMLRSPLESLELSHPELAIQLRSVSHQLHHANSESPSHSSSVSAEHRHRLAIEYNDLVAETRKMPSFEDFLRPVSSDKTRCDALLVIPECNEIIHVPLPDFNWNKAQHTYSEMEKSIRNKQSIERGVERRPVQEEEVDFKNVLADLWYSVVKPVLDFLGYMRRTLMKRKYDPAFPRTLSSSSRVLVIGQDATPGHQPLPGTAKELEYVVSHIKGRVEYLELFGDQATTTTVLEAMEQHEWVHLACHAHQNVQDPTDSGFFLHDGTLDLASINQRSFKSKGLAFLSACQTATGDEKLPDEAIHLASGMLMAGYSSVIATMWSVYDEDAPLVADRVYAQLMKDRRIGNGEAGKALHDAIAELRRKVGEKEFSRWVPYIHVGS